MYTTVVLSSLFLLYVTSTPQFHSHHGRRVCFGDGRSPRMSHITETFIQPVHKPYITMCLNQRLCSTYKTIYRVSYRQVSKAVHNVQMYAHCCPGWRRMHSHNCNQAVCELSCANGGSCLRPNLCTCPKGWMGQYCQTDVDECKETNGCSQKCVNTPGSYKCVCVEGFSLNEDGMTCLRIPTPFSPTAAPPTRDHLSSSADTGLKLMENVTEEVQMLKNRVEMLEQKLEMVLAPFTTLFQVDGVDESNGFLSDRTNFLSHSLQQLDRIDSLSEQVGFLEERIGACACQEN